MKYNVAAVLAVISFCLIATSQSKAAPAPNIPFGLTCNRVCYGTCMAIKKTCEAFPGLEDLCSELAAPCNDVCDRACPCFDGCLDKCQRDADECRVDATIIDLTHCTTVELMCKSTCYARCHFKSNIYLQQRLLGAISANIDEE